MKCTLLTGLCAALALAAGSALFSCGGGGSGGGGSSGSLSGTMTVALTDAISDEIESFRVTVTSLDVEKSNGTSLSVLSGPVTVDLAELGDTGQVLDTRPASIGSYTSATVALDFSGAVCLLAGQATPATLLDDQGQPIAAPAVLPVSFPSVFALGGSSHQEIEFDLDLRQSLQIDAGTNTVRFTPVLAVRTSAAQQKPIFLMGTLASTDVAGSTFVVDLEDDSSVQIGSVTCTSDASTVFQCDGLPDSGTTGLTALSNLPVGAWVQVQATIDPAATSPKATDVDAGRGTWNGGNDIVEGHVIDRSGGAGADATLTVLGRSSDAAHGSAQYDTTFTVSTSFASTHVVRQDSSTTFDTDEIDIGQRVSVYGTLTGTDLDASAGVLREQPTWIYAVAGGAPAGGQLTLALSSVGLHDASLFSWTVDPANLLTGVGTLADLLAISTGTHVLERGYFAGVSGGAADFTADAVENVDTAPSLLLVRNLLPVGTGFEVALTCGVSEIDVGITGAAAAGELAVVGQPFSAASNLPSTPTPNLVPAGALGMYSILDRSVSPPSLTGYLNFSAFSFVLGGLVGTGAQVRHLSAVGSWNGATNTLSATRASVVVQ